jgi:predicted dehydrogenase
MLQIGSVGCGSMASALLEKSVAMGRAKIAAIYDPDLENLANRCSEFGAQPCSSMEELMSIDAIDAFIVGSPPRMHYENVMALAPLGKPIYCEKPLCTTAELCTEMINACKAGGSKLFVGQVLRLFPFMWKSREVIDSGVIGQPILVTIRRAGFGGPFTHGWRTRFEDSGGLLLEVNSHELDYMIFLMGQPVEVLAHGFNLTHHGDFEDALIVTVKFESGGIGVLHSSLASPVGEYGIHIQCSNGNIIHGGFGGEFKVRSFTDEQTTVTKREELNHMKDPYDWELESFFDWVETDTPPFFTGEIGRQNVALADAAYKSLRTGTWEPVQRF